MYFDTAHFYIWSRFVKNLQILKFVVIILLSIETKEWTIKIKTFLNINQLELWFSSCVPRHVSVPQGIFKCTVKVFRILGRMMKFQLEIIRCGKLCSSELAFVPLNVVTQFIFFIFSMSQKNF